MVVLLNLLKSWSLGPVFGSEARASLTRDVFIRAGGTYFFYVHNSGDKSRGNNKNGRRAKVRGERRWRAHTGGGCSQNYVSDSLLPLMFLLLLFKCLWQFLFFANGCCKRLVVCFFYLFHLDYKAYLYNVRLVINYICVLE